MKPPASLESLGAKLAALQDESLLDDGTLDRAREAFLAHRNEAPRRRALDAPPSSSVPLKQAARPRWAPVAVLALVAAGMAGYGFVVRPTAPHTPLAFGVGQAVPSPGDWLAAPKTASLPVHFSDGTELLLAPASRARVVDVGDLGARVILERGAVHASVIHRESSRWYFAAGPFEVHVTGTQFQVGWQPAEGTFTLQLEEGSVTVTGCGMAGERAIRAGQSLRLVCDEEKMIATEARPEPKTPLTLDKAPEPAPAARQEGPAVTEGKKSPPRANVGPKDTKDAKDTRDAKKAELPPAPAASQAPPPAPPPAPWRVLFGADRFHEAYAAASQEGWARLCEERDVAELAALADIARFTGHFDQAEQALLAIRRRFPADERATWAAFQLGRLSFDQRGLPRDAAIWFDRAFRERPSGPLAREVLGRLMEARERTGELDAAREAARRYMASYPSGPHAERALELLERR